MSRATITIRVLPRRASNTGAMASLTFERFSSLIHVRDELRGLHGEDDGRLGKPPRVPWLGRPPPSRCAVPAKYRSHRRAYANFVETP